MTRCNKNGCDGRLVPVCSKCELIAWFSVHDRLPKINKVIVFIYNKEFLTGHYCGLSDITQEPLWRSYDQDYDCVYDVEYWMPLPELPQPDPLPYDEKVEHGYN